jgi:hypothetical protein
MAGKRSGIEVTPGQAQWIVQRMLAERRLSPADVRTFLADMGGEIAELERRLATLRGTARETPVAARTERPARAVRAPQRKRRKKATGHPRGIAGTLAVLLRSIPAAEHAAIAAIRADKGIKAAITAAKAAAKKA